jgi:NhaA family Na+:H+ antiporter
MSLFVSELAFKDPDLVSEAKVGILVASLIAGVWGYLVLARSLPRKGDT